MKFRKYIISLIFLFIMTSCVLAENNSVIIKLKKNVPSDILNGFKNNNPSGGLSSLADICRKNSISSSKQLFGNLINSAKQFKELTDFGFDRIFILNSGDAANAVNSFKKNTYVEYAEINNSLRLDDVPLPQNTNGFTSPLLKYYSPNDPYYSSQYYLPQVGMPAAWNITKGDTAIIVGVVDSGLDFLHPDLSRSYFINLGEFGNGKESNGIDDDGNGYTDDWRGWDFVDEPLTGDPARGDYLNPDNDPSDDNIYSHGTAVTGIINAGFNNGIGIASSAPNVKVLVLRAFDAQGQGLEDNVASAIIYGVSMGVRVFNLSFGDYVYSNLLRDVIRYAYFKNAAIVCSAGNDSRDGLHYPSAFDEVISVGASDPEDRKTSFSSYGETLDIFAPGAQILTTSRKGKGFAELDSNYIYINGTSFSAPIVTGVSALLLSRNRNLTNEEIRGILVSSTTMMQGQTEWDHKYSSGRLDALKALKNYNLPSICRIFSPYQDYFIDKDTLPVCVSAASSFFLSFSLYYGIGQNPSSFIPLVQNISRQVIRDTVYNWNTAALPDTSYTLRLAINTISGGTIEHRMIIFKDKTNPKISYYTSGDIIDRENFSNLIYFTTDKNTTGKIYYRKKNTADPYKYIFADAYGTNTGLYSDLHFALLRGTDLVQGADYEFYIEATSQNGKSVTANDTSFVFSAGKPIDTYGYIQKSYVLPNSQSCYNIIDINGNGKKDILLNEIKNNLRLNIYEFGNNTFAKISNNNWADFEVARDIQDVNSNGKFDVLISKGRNGALYEAPEVNSLPTVKIWSDEGSNNFWSARISETDGDGKKEILGFGTTGLRILESTGGNNFTQIANLPYLKANSEANSQNVLVEDFDNNGKKDIFFIDLFFRNNNSQFAEIGLNMYENNGDNSYSRVWSDSLDRETKGDNIISGDFNGDGKKDFAIGTYSRSSEPLQYYSIYVYSSTGLHSYSLLDVISLYNYKSYTETSLRSGDIDNDSKDEILINSGTDFHILKYNGSSSRFDPVYYRNNINTVNQIVYDFDGNGVNEIGLNTVSDTLMFIEKDIAFTGPQTPSGITGFSLDSNMAQISFNSVPSAQYYKIYRAVDSNQNYSSYDSVSAVNYIDNNVINSKTYYYKVTAINNLNPVRESKLSEALKIYIHNKSRLKKSLYAGNGFIEVEFTQKIKTGAPAFGFFVLNPDAATLKSISVKNDFTYLLSYGAKIPDGNYTLKTNGLTDFYGSPVDTNSVSFIANQVEPLQFFLQKLVLEDKTKIRLEFNMPVDSVSASNPVNFKLEPFNFTINRIEIDRTSRNIIYIYFSGTGNIGASGKNYVLRVSNVYSSGGIKITEGAGSSFSLSFFKETLDDATVYPNPWTSGSAQNYVIFANLTKTATVQIYDLNGKFLKEIKETDGNGGVEWDLKDSGGRDVPTGIYLFRAEGKDSNGLDLKGKTGKFAVVR